MQVMEVEIKYIQSQIQHASLSNILNSIYFVINYFNYLSVIL